MKRYSIMVTQTGCDREVEHSQCNSNPEAIAQGLREKTTLGCRHLPIYQSVRVVDHQRVPA